MASETTDTAVGDRLTRCYWLCRAMRRRGAPVEALGETERSATYNMLSQLTRRNSAVFDGVLDFFKSRPGASARRGDLVLQHHDSGQDVGANRCQGW